MIVINHNRSKRCPIGTRRVKGTNTCSGTPRPRKQIRRKPVELPIGPIPTAIPMAQALPIPFAQATRLEGGRGRYTPMVRAVPVSRDLGLPTVVPHPMAHARVPQMAYTQHPLVLATAVKPTPKKRATRPRKKRPSVVDMLIEEI